MDCNPCCDIGRLGSDSNHLSGVEDYSGPRIGTTAASETKSNTWKRRRVRTAHDKIARLTEGKIVSTSILQNLEKALSTPRKREDQMNIKLDEHAEPGQAGVKKARNAATPVSQIEDAWDFMKMGTEVGSNPEVEIPQPTG